MTIEPEKTKNKKRPLAYIQDRWDRELAPVLTEATLQQQEQLEVLWERTLRWLKEERGLVRDSLRKPITQIRTLIKELPLTPDNTWQDPRSRQPRPEHVAYHIFNLPEDEWERMNADSQLTLQERLENQQFLDNPDAIVNQALILIQSDDWAELVVGLALATGRRLAELLKTCRFTEKTAYSVWFTGLVKGHGREDEGFEIPTPVRAFLVVEGLQRLRRLIDCTELEPEQVSQRYNQAVNKVVNQYFGELIPVRVTRERLSVHVLRTVYARIATYWYAPQRVADITYMAQIQGHRYILDPEREEGETDDDIQNKRLNYAANANYFDYKLRSLGADGQYHIEGDQGIHLGRPGVKVLEAFAQEAVEEASGEIQGKGKRKGKEKKESTSSWVPITVQRHTRDWFREIETTVKGPSQQSQRDDALLRKLLTLYVVGGQAEPSEGARSVVSLDLLEIPEKTRDLLRQAMALSGSVDLLSFLIATAEPEAQRLVKQATRHGAERFRTVPTDQLVSKDPEASTERFRRAVYTVMEYNRTHQLSERWFLSDLAIQNLVGGSKESIKAYKAAHAEEIAVHHREFGIEPGFNRKPGNPRIQEVIQVPNEPSAFPWGPAAAMASE